MRDLAPNYIISQHINTKPTTKSVELINFKVAISRDFKHKNTTPASTAPELLTNQRSISTEGIDASLNPHPLGSICNAIL
jgi:hypothetical protein